MVVHGVDHLQMSVLVSDSMMASLIWFPLLLIPVHVSSVTSADWIQVLLHVSVPLSVCGPARLSAVFMPTTLPGSPQELAELSYKRCSLPLNIPRPGLLSSSHPQTHIKATTFPVRRWCRRLSGGLKSRSAVTGPTSRGHRPPALLRTRCI